MPVRISGIGVLSDEEYAAISPKDDYNLMLDLPNGGRLYMGETPDSEDVYLNKTEYLVNRDDRPFSRLVTPERFDVRIDLYGHNHPAAEGVAEYVIRMGDSDITRWREDEFLDLGDAVYFAFQGLSDGGRVLVNCQAGLNRSGLVTGLVMMAYGFDAETAIETIRRNRARLCLANGSFETFLREKGREFALAAIALEDA
jgi:hypothetical protein